MTCEHAEACAGLARDNQEPAMTRLAKPLLLETPCCQTKVMQRRLASVNTFGLAKAWSDGYTSVFMVSEAQRLAYCAGCNSVYWLEDATVLGVIPSSDERAGRCGGWLARIFGKQSNVGLGEKQTTVDLLDLDFVDYHQYPRPADLLLAVLREEWTKPERELYLRTWLWWIGNHRQRGRRTLSPMTDEQANENMRRLLALHQAAPMSDKGIEAIGELLRQLGRFGEAMVALDDILESNARAAAIHADAARNESSVFELEPF